MNYGYKKQINIEFEDAVEKIKEELQKEGFGVLTEIDVKKTLKEKLNIDYENYAILGVCNPSFAYKALQAEKEIGLLLPCNIIVYEEDSKVFVSAINPLKAMSIVNNKNLKDIAQQIKKKLKRIIENVR